MRVFALWIIFVLSVAGNLRAATEIIPVGEIKPGMRGITYTVMKGTEIVPIETEILGVLESGIAPGHDLIIGRLVDSKTQLTGAVHGMSGSPLYIDGKLAGALSRRLMIFEKDGHCGFTPIEDMLDVGQRKTRPKYELKEKLAFRDLGIIPSGDQSQGQLLCVPLSITGWKDSWKGVFDKLFASYPNRFTPVAGGSSAKSRDTEFLLKPGSPVAAVLVSGDITIAGTGTLTWMDGDNVLAFGHSMMELGPVALPMAGAEIVTVLPSYYMPHKISNTGKIVGQINQDRLSAIAGTVGKIPGMATYEITRTHEGEVRKTWKGGLLRDPNLLPQLVAMLYMNSITETQDYSDNFTMELTSKIQFKGLPPLEVSRAYSGESSFSRILAVFENFEAMVRLFSAFPNEVDLESVKLDVKTWESSKVWNLTKVFIPVHEVSPGDKIPVTIEFKNLDGQFKVVTQDIVVPEEIKDGNFHLRVVSGNVLLQKDRWKLNVSPDTKPADLIAALNRSYNSRSVYVELATPAAGYMVNLQEQRNLPVSVLEVMRSNGRKGNLTPLNEYVRLSREIKLDGVVWGSIEEEMSITK